MPRKVVRDKEKTFNANLPIVGSVIKTVAEIGNIPTEAKQKLVNPVKAQRRELRKLLRHRGKCDRKRRHADLRPHGGDGRRSLRDTASDLRNGLHGR